MNSTYAHRVGCFPLLSHDNVTLNWQSIFVLLKNFGIFARHQNIKRNSQEVLEKTENPEWPTLCKCRFSLILGEEMVVGAFSQQRLDFYLLKVGEVCCHWLDNWTKSLWGVNCLFPLVWKKQRWWSPRALEKQWSHLWSNLIYSRSFYFDKMSKCSLNLSFGLLNKS